MDFKDKIGATYKGSFEADIANVAGVIHVKASDKKATKITEKTDGKFTLTQPTFKFGKDDATRKEIKPKDKSIFSISKVFDATVVAGVAEKSRIKLVGQYRPQPNWNEMEYSLQFSVTRSKDLWNKNQWLYMYATIKDAKTELKDETVACIVQVGNPKTATVMQFDETFAALKADTKIDDQNKAATKEGDWRTSSRR